VELFEKAFGIKRRFIHESGYGEMDTGSTALAFTLAPLTFTAETSSNSFDGKTLITGSEPAGALPITVWVTVGGQTTLVQVSQTQANL
jgi:hypothetical protein